MSLNICVCGLGNPGNVYFLTRHNVGFLVCDFLFSCFKLDVWKNFQDRILYSKTIVNNANVYLVKPQEYMNNSGKSLRYFCDYFRLSVDDVIVVYDDIDTPFGSIRIRKKGSSGNHNGMQDIIDVFKTDDIKRIRIGIGPKPRNIELKDYVLSEFSKSELDKLKEILSIFPSIIMDYIKNGIDYIISKYNKKIF